MLYSIFICQSVNSPIILPRNYYDIITVRRNQRCMCIDLLFSLLYLSASCFGSECLLIWYRVAKTIKTAVAKEVCERAPSKEAVRDDNWNPKSSCFARHVSPLTRSVRVSRNMQSAARVVSFNYHSQAPARESHVYESVFVCVCVCGWFAPMSMHSISRTRVTLLPQRE
jgi:hypothetical protein